MIPGYDPWKTAGESWFDVEAAQKAVAFFPLALKHVEGAAASKPFRLELWQQAIIGNLFGMEAERLLRPHRPSLS